MRRLAILCFAAFAACSPPDPAVDDQPTEDDDEASLPEGGDDDLDPPPSGDPAQLVAGCTARAMIEGVPAWFHFVRPDRPCSGTAGSGVDQHAILELVRLIESVPPGGRIDGHIFNITIAAVGKALLDAQARGVEVRISTDGQVKTSASSVKTDYLDKLSGIVYCASAANNACVSNATNAISHTKLFVFSTATAPDLVESDYVVWLGSANQTSASGMKLYNNTVTLYGDAPLYSMMRDYLDDLRARTRSGDYYEPSSGRGHLLAATADVFVSPEAQTDLVVNRLDDVAPDGNCEVRVMHASIRDSRMEVVRQLVAMKRGGCKVQVVANTIEPDALAALKGANIPVREMLIHDKVFIIYGRYGTGYQYRVYTGSHNLSGSANSKYDEILVKLAPEMGDEQPVYDAYIAHFDDAYSVATPR